MLRSTLLSLYAIFLIASPLSAADKTTLNIAAPWEINSYEPSVSGFAFLRLEVLETLVDATETGALIPSLATDWSASEDGLRWSFTIRENVLFHDGTKLTASIVVDSLNRTLAKPGMLKKAPISNIALEDNSTNKVIITLEKPFTALPSILTHATTVIPAPSSIKADGSYIAAIGTGPFAVEKFSPPQGLSLVRYEKYWGDNAKLEKVSYLAAGRAETRALLAESGDADIVYTLDPSGFSHLKSIDTLKTQALPIPRVVTLKLNLEHEFLKDVRARQALSLAIDRKGIATAITRFPEASATQLFPPALDKWHDATLAPLENNVEKAKQLLADLGWKKGDDGILIRDGKRFSLLLRTFPDRPELPLMAAALQNQWKAIGVALEVSVNNYSEIPAGHKDGSLHVALYARNYGLTPDPIGTALADFGTGGGDWGAMGWENPEVANALDEIAATNDAEKRSANIAKVVNAIQTELPLLPVVWYQHTVSASTALEGFKVDPLERKYRLSRVSWAK